MEYRDLGESGLKVSKVVIGCMTFGSKHWLEWIIDDEEESFRILKKCYDNGFRTFDTADVYSNGESEIILGKFLRKYNIPRDRVVILSKCHFPVDTRNANFNHHKSSEYPGYEYANCQGLSRKHILDSAKNSVERLGTYMDVLQIHRLDHSTPKTEIMRSLNDVVLAGYARYIGASTMKAVEFAELQYIADKNGWFKFISMQNYYNLLYREQEREMIPFCQSTEFGKVGLIPYSPLARGLLTRPLDKKSTVSTRDENSDYAFKTYGLDKLSDSDREIIKRVQELSEKKNVSMAAISCAWIIHKGCSPIVGVNSVKRVDDLVTAVNLKLTDDEIDYLEGPYTAKSSVT